MTGQAEALFSAINESIWEHLKLLFYPMVVFALVEYYFWGKVAASFWRIKLLGILIGLMLIVVVLCLLSAFTFNPPRIPLFQAPLTGSYGFRG